MIRARATFGCCGAPATPDALAQHKCNINHRDHRSASDAGSHDPAQVRSRRTVPATTKPAWRAAEDKMAEALRAAGFLLAGWREWLLASEADSPVQSVVIREYRWGQTLDPERRYRSDFAFPRYRLLLEVDGRVHHVVAKQGRVDVLRAQLAEQAGYRILRLLPEQVATGEALALVRGALKGGG